VPWLRDEYGSPSSVYSLGKRAAAALDHAREQVAGLIGRTPEATLALTAFSNSDVSETCMRWKYKLWQSL